MHPVRRISLPDQAAAHLREGLRRGRWGGKLPGVLRLATELDVSPKTLRAALRRLEADGLLSERGRGRSRTVTRRGATRHDLRVGVLLFEPPLNEQTQVSQLLFQIQHDLEAAGHEVFFAARTQADLHHDFRRIVRHIRDNRADAWIVLAGSRVLLRWFSRQPVPCLALFGRKEGLPLARTGLDKVPGYLTATRRLLELGHQRIVLIERRTRREPVPGDVESAFLAELAAHKISTGPFNLPDWEETPEGFDALLQRLFRVTPPTALIIDEAPLAIAAVQFLARRGIKLPGQVSLVTTDRDASLGWCHPPMAHMRWDGAPIVRRVVRWIGAVRSGRADHKAVNFPVEFVPGGTLGPVPSR